MIRSLLQTTARRKLSLLIQRNLPSNKLALATFANESDHSSSYKSLNTVCVFLSASLAIASTSTKCDDNNDNDDNDTEVDPYGNLPEEDEQTHCSICKTYRQGPCRPYWRKVEACTKDNELKDDKDEKKSDEIEEEDAEERDPPCLKYMLPWIDCATGYRNMYNLIELDTNYTMGIEDLEKEATQNLCWAPSNTPTVDWSSWQSYVESNKWEPPSISKKATSAEKVSFWKTLDQNKDPELVEVEAIVSMTQDDGVLECAYAQDQDGNVLGFSYGQKPSEASTEEAKEEQQENAVTLKIKVLPTMTKTVTIAAAYTQPRKEEAKGDAQLESHIFKSQPYSLQKVGVKKEKEVSNEKVIPSNTTTIKM
jgi:hypothetical protein